ncbi:alcohol dehydrogenase catalytic domain-containing protein [Streptomyces sp. CC208A]|uniref:alcohol dehydrogenase catalytic domain-containing protein n=1 Tax=Streptomyces sp. CC208A TaxID=3044573 RepID=UPI0024A837C4|nr:alcohol dehydrogenase catalytic domain-containing protein [Streptomyces sp. CC208A]
MPLTPIPATYETTTLRDGVVGLATHAFPHQELTDGTVVIKPAHMGVCRADIKEVLGSRDVPEDRGPLFGHELVGPVVFAGSATGFREGEQVTFNPNITPDRTTGFAEYVLVRGTKEQLDQAVVRVPEPALRDGVWMPEPFACVVHAVRKLLALAGPPSFEGKRVGIVGAGCAGLMFAMYARHLGGRVSVFNRGAARRAFARERGLLADAEVHPLTEATAYGDAFDAVIVAPTVVTPDLLALAAGTAADGAVLLVYGGTRAGDRFPGNGNGNGNGNGGRSLDVDAVRRQERLDFVEYGGKRLGVAGAYGCFREDYEEGFRLRAEHPDAFPLDRLASRRIGMADLPALVMATASGAVDHPGKVLVETATD